MQLVETKLNAPVIEAACNEFAQPLTVMTSLLELWEQGLSEPEDLALMKQQVIRMGLALKELRGLSESNCGPATRLELDAAMFSNLLSSFEAVAL